MLPKHLSSTAFIRTCGTALLCLLLTLSLFPRSSAASCGMACCRKARTCRHKTNPTNGPTLTALRDCARTCVPSAALSTLAIGPATNATGLAAAQPALATPLTAEGRNIAVAYALFQRPPPRA